MTRYTEGFSHFVTSMTAPGWSDGLVGLAPTEERRLSTAHTQSGLSVLYGGEDRQSKLGDAFARAVLGIEP